MAGPATAHNLLLPYARGPRCLCEAGLAPYNRTPRIRLRLPTQVRFYYRWSVICRPNPQSDLQDEPLSSLSSSPREPPHRRSEKKRHAYLPFRRWRLRPCRNSNRAVMITATKRALCAKSDTRTSAVYRSDRNRNRVHLSDDVQAAEFRPESDEKATITGAGWTWSGPGAPATALFGSVTPAGCQESRPALRAASFFLLQTALHHLSRADRWDSNKLVKPAVRVAKHCRMHFFFSSTRSSVSSLSRAFPDLSLPKRRVPPRCGTTFGPRRSLMPSVRTM